MDLELICLLFSEFCAFCVSFFAQASWETEVWLHMKAEIPISAQAVRSLDFQKSRNHCATCSKFTRAGNTKLTAPLTPWELHWGWLRPTSCLKLIYLGENPLSCFLWLKNTAASEGWTRPLSWWQKCRFYSSEKLMENYKPNTLFSIEKKIVFVCSLCSLVEKKKKTTQFMTTVNVWMLTLWIGVLTQNRDG